MIPKYEHAIVKWNGGRGALLCNRCGTIVAKGFEHKDIEHFCAVCAHGAAPEAPSNDVVIRGSGDFLKDMGYQNPDEMREKFKLANAIACAIEDLGIAHAEAAATAHVTEADIDRIVRGCVKDRSAVDLGRVLRALQWEC